MEQKTPAELLVESLKDVRTVAIRAFTSTDASPEQGDKDIVIMEWWNRVGKNLFQQIEEDTTDVLDQLEKIFPGVSHFIIGGLIMKIDGKEFYVEEAGLSKLGEAITIPIYQNGKPKDGLDWIASGFYEGSDYDFVLKGSYQGEDSANLRYPYGDEIMIQTIETIDLM